MRGIYLDMTNIIYKPKVTLISKPDFLEPYHLPVNWIGIAEKGEKLSEYAGRLCYMSQKNPANKTTKMYIENIMQQHHGSVLEHANYSFLLEGISRSCTHELVRHRAGMAYSQLSQRYVDESDASFIIPPAMIGYEGLEMSFISSVQETLVCYKEMITQLEAMYEPLISDKHERRKKVREAARSLLPNSIETKIVATGNVRAWRHILELRSGEGADQEIRRLAISLITVFKNICPIFFQDFEIIPVETGIPTCLVGYSKV